MPLVAEKVKTPPPNGHFSDGQSELWEGWKNPASAAVLPPLPPQTIRVRVKLETIMQMDWGEDFCGMRVAVSDLVLG